jgi:hypothetical protein
MTLHVINLSADKEEADCIFQSSSSQNKTAVAECRLGHFVAGAKLDHRERLVLGRHGQHQGVKAWLKAGGMPAGGWKMADQSVKAQKEIHDRGRACNARLLCHDWVN